MRLLRGRARERIGKHRAVLRAVALIVHALEEKDRGCERRDKQIDDGNEMTAEEVPPMTPERWLANILDVTAQIADRERQERRWLAPDVYAWECPDELICSLDDVVFDGFLERYTPTFSAEQREAALGFRDALNQYCDITPHHLDPGKTLADPRWDFVRRKAAALVAAFSKKWPPSDSVN